jgi:hypothetical protein
LLLSAQVSIAASRHREAARRAVDFLDLFPLDPRDDVARVLLARALFGLGKPGAALRTLALATPPDGSGLDYERLALGKAMSLRAFRTDEGNPALHLEQVSPASGVSLRSVNGLDTILSIAFSRTGLVAIGGEDGILILDRNQGFVRRRLPVRDVSGVAFTGHGTQLLVLSEASGLRRYRLRGGEDGQASFVHDRAWLAEPPGTPETHWEWADRSYRGCGLLAADPVGWTYFACDDEDLYSVPPGFGEDPGVAAPERSPVSLGSARDLVGLFVDGTRRLWLVGERSRDRYHLFRVDTATGRTRPLEVPASVGRIEEIKAAAGDGHGWVYLAIEQRRGQKLVVLDTRDGEIVDSLPLNEDLRVSAMGVSESGNVMLGTERTGVLAFSWVPER